MINFAFSSNIDDSYQWLSYEAHSELYSALHNVPDISEVAVAFFSVTTNETKNYFNYQFGNLFEAVTSQT